MKLTYKLVKDVFGVDKSLTRNLWDNFGIGPDTWLVPANYWYVVFDKKDWVAYSGMRVHDNISCYCGPSYVKLEYRGNNLQKKLLRKRIRLAKKMGYTKLLSSTFMDNYPSNNSLISCGFKLVEAWADKSEHSLYWAKEI